MSSIVTHYYTKCVHCSVNAGFDQHDFPMDVIWLDIEHTDGKKLVDACTWRIWYVLLECFKHYLLNDDVYSKWNNQP